MLSLGAFIASPAGRELSNKLFNSISTSTEGLIHTINKHIYGTSEPTQTIAARHILQRSCSIEDLILQIELQSQHPFVQTMQRLRNMFGEQWPPRASFEDWPKHWAPYLEMAEELSYKLRDLDSPKLFREWINEIGKKIDVEAMTQEIGEILARDGHNTAVYGLMGALAKLIFAYRWGRLPALEEELNRKTLEFPAHLMKPFEKMSEHYGTIPRGCMFSTSFGNAVYEEGSDGPQKCRFFFTTDELMRETETNFFNCFAHMDVEFGKTMGPMTKYMALTDMASRAEPELQRQLLDDRVECLREITKHLKSMFKVFGKYINERKVKKEYWAPYLQGATAWNINGMMEGMSGAETLAFHLLDAFLSVKGDSPVAQASIKKLQTIPEVCRDLVAALNDDTMDRFDTFCNIGDEEDPIAKAKEEMLNSLYLWRLGHAKVPARYFNAENKTTSGGVVENVGESDGTLVEITERQLRQRAMETKACLQETKAKQLKN